MKEHSAMQEIRRGDKTQSARGAGIMVQIPRHASTASATRWITSKAEDIWANLIPDRIKFHKKNQLLKVQDSEFYTKSRRLHLKKFVIRKGSSTRAVTGLLSAGSTTMKTDKEIRNRQGRQLHVEKKKKKVEQICSARWISHYASAKKKFI
jgi:hypothetical protein